jgi:hypothetical protein
VNATQFGIKERDVSKYYGSIRHTIERAVAGAVFGGAMLLVVSGAFAICFGSAGFGA